MGIGDFGWGLGPIPYLKSPSQSNLINKNIYLKIIFIHILINFP